MRRREFITLLGGAAVAWPLAARAQQPAMPVIGYLRPGPPGGNPEVIASFRQGLTEAGYVEGQNVAIEYRFANDQAERLPALGADLVRRRVALISTGGPPAAFAAKAATTAIPIVFLIGDDPVKLGLVAAMNRPGGNVTGVTNIAVGLGAKRIELLHELVPSAGRVAILRDPAGTPVENTEPELREAARTLGLDLIFLNVSNPSDFVPAFASLAQQQARALLVTDETLFNAHRAELVALAAHHAVPAIYTFREFAAAGGLISYAPSLTDVARMAGVYAGRILKGEKPGNLPIWQPTRFQLVINLKTAKALGLTVPPTMLAIADEVIE
jgi:putative ABC transport system substrate-binding protein